MTFTYDTKCINIIYIYKYYFWVFFTTLFNKIGGKKTSLLSLDELVSNPSTQGNEPIVTTQTFNTAGTVNDLYCFHWEVKLLQGNTVPKRSGTKGVESLVLPVNASL